MFGFSRVTPWVGRLVVVNAVVLLVLQTLLTSPAVTSALAFNPGSPFAQPWTYVTYAFVHADLWHLLFNMLGLYVFGTAVEERLGGRVFIAFWVFASIGAAIVTALVHPLFPIAPVVGASASVLGVAIVFALSWPDAEMLVFPIPVPIRARTLAILLVTYNAVMVLISRSSNVAYEAHLAGALMGWLFVRVSMMRNGRPISDSFGPIERSWAPSSAGLPRVGNSSENGPGAAPASTTRPIRRPSEPRIDPERLEIDRVLDKISATGIASLSLEERRFLDEASSRRKQSGDSPH